MYSGYSSQGVVGASVVPGMPGAVTPVQMGSSVVNPFASGFASQSTPSPVSLGNTSSGFCAYGAPMGSLVGGAYTSGLSTGYPELSGGLSQGYTGISSMLPAGYQGGLSAGYQGYSGVTSGLSTGAVGSSFGGLYGASGLGALYGSTSGGFGGGAVYAGGLSSGYSGMNSVNLSGYSGIASNYNGVVDASNYNGGYISGGYTAAPQQSFAYSVAAPQSFGMQDASAMMMQQTRLLALPAPPVAVPVAVPVPQPYPVAVPEPYAVPYAVEKPVPVPVAVEAPPPPPPKPEPKVQWQYRAVAKSSDPAVQAQAQSVLDSRVGEGGDPSAVLMAAQSQLDGADGAGDGAFHGHRIVAHGGIHGSYHKWQSGSVSSAQGMHSMGGMGGYEQTTSMPPLRPPMRHEQ